MYKVQFLCAVFLSFCFSTAFSQKCELSENDSLRKVVDSIAVVPEAKLLYRDYGIPFIKWKTKPQSFKFTLFDRWGRVFDQSENPDYVVDADNIKKEYLREGDLYYYAVKIITQAGEKIFFCGKLTYIGYWRCG